MQFRAKQIAPPKEWSLFEDLCHALFKVVWKDPLAQKNGRKGQPQHGVDVFGSAEGIRNAFQGVQCKGKDQNYGGQATLKELRNEVSKAEEFSPKLKHWILATTSPSDSALQEAARELSVERSAKGLFTVDVLGWEEIQALLAQAPHVLEEFYPEHAMNLPAVLEALRALPSPEQSLKLSGLIEQLGSRLENHQGAATAAVWQVVSFETSRDIGPALLGRPLGPSDANACPRLTEADQLVSQLMTAFAARIVGEPGAGKSICAYQAAMSLAAQGFEILRLMSPQVSQVQLDRADSVRRRLYLLDDAHLIPPHVLKALEDDAGADRLVLSVHNAAEQSTTHRGAVALDPLRAVRTIAKALRANLTSTLNAVRRADDQIGDGMMDADLEQRIDDAEKNSNRPWQFCFILGGGWRRAKQAADAARTSGADIVLATVALHQLASRDARASPAAIQELCRPEGISAQAVDQALTWLAAQRLLLSIADCRCPHQHFAAVVLRQILVGQDRSGRELIGRLADEVLCRSQYPLAGLRVLLHEIRFGGDYIWTWIIQPTTVLRLSERCWRVADSEERNYAALALVEISGYSKNWSRDIIAPHVDTLARWISNPTDSAYGIARLLNDLSREGPAIAKSAVSATDARAVADAFASVTLETAYGLADLMQSVGSVRAEDWNTRMLESLSREKLLKIAKEWNQPEQAFLFSKVCSSMAWWDENCMLEMAEQFIPAAQSALSQDIVEGFSDLDGIAMRVLRVSDPLGVFVGKLKPDKRRWMIARAMCANLDPGLIAGQVSKARRRDFQTVAQFLHFLFRCAPRKFKDVISQLDWARLEIEIGDAWSNLPHEAEVLLGTLYAHPSGRAAVTAFINRNLKRIETFPPRLALLAPDAAVEHATSGRTIRLAQHGHVDWRFGGVALAIIGDAKPELLDTVVSPFKGALAKAISSPNATFFDEAEPLIRVLVDKVPQVFRQILSEVNVEVAEKGLADCLEKGGGHARAAALLVQFALDSTNGMKEMAARLRKRFSSASIPPKDSPLIVSRRPRGRAKPRKPLARTKGDI